MKSFKYLSAFSGSILLVYWLMSVILDYYVSIWFFIAGITLLGLVFLPLAMLDSHRREIRFDTRRKKDAGKIQHRDSSSTEKPRKARKGQGVTQSRERSSGLRWEGGSVYGANAKRGSKRSFLGRK